MATKKTTKPKASNLTQQVATRMDVASFARLLAQTLGNDRWFTDDVINKTFKESGPSGNKLAKDTSKTTKIPLIKSEDKVMSSLMAIHNLLKNSYEEKLKTVEKQNQFKEEHDLEKKKQNQEFLKAIKDLKGTKEAVPTATKEKQKEEESDDLLGVLKDLKDLASILFKVGTFFLTPWGAFILASTSLITLLAGDKNPEATTKGMLAAGDVGEANKQMMEVVENTNGAERRKQNLLADRPSEFKASFLKPWQDKEYQDKYLAKIGFDSKTGLTEAEKNEGFTGVTDEGVPYKKPKGSPAAAPTTTETPSTTTPAPATPPAVPPSTESGTTSATEAPTAPATVPTTAAMAEPMSSSAVSQKFNNVNSENLEMKLPQQPSERGSTITNNQINKQQGPTTRQQLPGVRNDEPTFQRMILNSTRVV